MRGGGVVFDQWLQCRFGAGHRAGRRRKSRQRDLSFQDQGWAASRNLPSSLRTDEPQAVGVAGGGEASARSPGPAGGHRPRLCAARVFVRQRPCRRRARASPGCARLCRRKETRSPARLSRKPSTTPVMPLSTRSTRACRTFRARKSSGAVIFFSARFITPWYSLNVYRVCREARPMVPMRPMPSSGWYARLSRHFKPPKLIGRGRYDDGLRLRPQIRNTGVARRLLKSETLIRSQKH